MAQQTLPELVASIRADAKTYHRWVDQPGFWVTLSYRLRRFRKIGPAWAVLTLPIDIFAGALRAVVSDSKIPSNCSVGPGLCLPHAHGIILNDQTTIGANVRIFQQVTIGVWEGLAPTLLDGCSIYAGARVFGRITIGRDARIGPNAVVDTSVPDRCNVRTAPPVVTERRGANRGDAA